MTTSSRGDYRDDVDDDLYPTRRGRRTIVRPAATITGTIVGLALGFAVMFGNFVDLVVIALFTVIGYVVGKVVEGELDLTGYLGGRRRRDDQ